MKSSNYTIVNPPQLNNINESNKPIIFQYLPQQQFSMPTYPNFNYQMMSMKPMVIPTMGAQPSSKLGNFA